MQDFTPEQLARFRARHADLLDLRGHPTVQDLAKQVLTGGMTALQFAEKLTEVPEVATALHALEGGGETLVGGIATGAAAPLGPFAPLVGAAAAGAFHLASAALADAFHETPPASPTT